MDDGNDTILGWYEGRKWKEWKINTLEGEVSRDERRNI